MQRSTQSPDKATSHIQQAPQMGVTFGVSYNFQNAPTQSPMTHQAPQPHYYTSAHNAPYPSHYPDSQFSFSIPGIGSVWGNPETIQTFQKLDSLLTQIKSQNAEQRTHLEYIYSQLEQQHITLQEKTIELQRTMSENAALDEQIKKMHTANQALSQQNHHLYTHANSVEEKNHILIQESKVQSQKIRRYSSQNSALKSAYDVTIMQLETSKIQTDQFKLAYQASKQTIEEKDHTIESLRAQLTAAQAEISTLKEASSLQESTTVITPREEIEEVVPILVFMKNASAKKNIDTLKERFLSFQPENKGAQKPSLRPTGI